MAVETAHGVNRLIAALPPRERARLLAAGSPVSLTRGQVLHTAGRRVRDIYFPHDSFVALTLPGEGCAGIGVGLIGCEGMLGIQLAFGGDQTSFHAVVRGAGPALRINAGFLVHQLGTNPALRTLIQRYSHVVTVQLAQAVVCARFHVVQARLASLLSMMQDRTQAGGLCITHEILARILGVRRAGVSAAAKVLARRNLISYQRGDVSIPDRTALAAVACPCYVADKLVYARLTGSGMGRRRGGQCTQAHGPRRAGLL